MKGGSNGAIEQVTDPISALLFYVNSDTASYGGEGDHKDWILRSVIATSGEAKYRSALEKIPLRARVLLYVKSVGVVAVGETTSTVISDVRSPDTINPSAPIEYHRSVSWQFVPPSDKPITIQKLLDSPGWVPRSAIQQIKKGKERLCHLLAILEAVPTSDMDTYLRVASELCRYGLVDKPTGNLMPIRTSFQGTHFSRDPRVRAWTLLRAGGHCELCEQPAPFLDEYQKPYLESHHIEMLSNGGADTPENTSALCANCHRELHFGVESRSKSARLRALIFAKELHLERMNVGLV